MGLERLEAIQAVKEAKISLFRFAWTKHQQRPLTAIEFEGVNQERKKKKTEFVEMEGEIMKRKLNRREKLFVPAFRNLF